MQKAKRDDFRMEEELRANRAKYEESNEDVMRRMQDVKDAEVDSIRDLTAFLDCELDFHERCAEELRRVKRTWPGAATAAAAANGTLPSTHGGRSRSNTARSYNSEAAGNRGRSNTARSYNTERTPSAPYTDDASEPMPVRMPIRSSSRVAGSPPEKPARPVIGRSNTLQPGSANTSAPPTTYSTYNNINVSPGASAIASLRTGLRPVGRTQTTNGHGNGNNYGEENDDTASGSGSGSPEWNERSASPATSYGSLSRSTSNVAMGGNSSVAGRKAPPPPPPIRSKKPPIPAPRRESNY